MLVEVSKERVTITQGGHVNAGEMNVNTCTFFLPECFEGLNVTACFNGIPVPVVKNNCTIPALKQGTAILGVYAYKENDDGLELIYSPEPTCFCVHNGSFTEDFEQELTFEISEYEQYCNMLKSEYEKTEALFSSAEEERREAETLRANAEGMRQSEFATNEAQRQVAFEINEQKRVASFGGTYTNLLKDIAQEDSTLIIPAQFPCHKIGVVYEPSWRFDFESRADKECYIFNAQQGDRFNMSGFNIASASSNPAVIAMLDSNFSVVQYLASASSAAKFCCGLYACPENTAYVIINKAIDGLMPVVTKVDEPVIETIGGFIPSGTKCLSALNNGTLHSTYYGDVGGAMGIAWKNESYTYYSNGIYPLEEGKEYVLYIPESISNIRFAFMCDENFVTCTQVMDEDFDVNRRYVFTATEKDKYIAINCCDFSTIQFGENKCNKIKAGASIGNAFFDGKNHISLKEIGVIDRSLSDKKWVSYGDSITFGVGVDFVNGEKLWQDYIVDRYNINHVKMGEGYTSLAHKNGEVGECYCHDSRLNALINESPDIVTILGGANDYIFNIPIGTDVDVENKNIETFKGAYAYIIDRILTAKPDTIIILMGMFHNAMGAYGEGKGAYPLKEYGIATKEIAECFGLPFVDLNECGFNRYTFNITDGVFSTDGIHPNKEGAKRIAMVVSKWFDTFKSTVF